MIKAIPKPIDLLESFEKAFAVTSLVLYMGAVTFLIITQGSSEGDGSDVFSFNYTPVNLLYILNYLITISLLFLRWPKVLSLISHNLYFLAFTLMAPLSVAWSAMPDSTLSGSIGLIGSMLFGLYLASRFSLKEQLRLISYAFLMVIILSVIFIVAVPKYGIMGGTHAGTPRGVFTHKNGLGKSMVLSNAVFLLILVGAKSGSEKIFAWLGVTSSTVLIFLSSSTGAILNGLILALAVILISQMLQFKPSALAFSTILLVLFSWATSTLIIDIATPILDFFDKDLTLTGRTDIWPAVIQKIQERPWLGYGFAGFWHGLQGESAHVIRTVRWDVVGAHNGFLDLMLAFGLSGMFFFLLIVWSTLVKAISIVRIRFCPEYLWPTVFIAYMALVNFSESTLMSQNNFFWIVFTASALSTSYEFKALSKSPQAASGSLEVVEAS
jgi:exopolysaccharide production protein ExoQ